MAAASWGCCIPAGPSPEEPQRVADLLDALGHYEPGVRRVIIIDDAPELGRDLAAGAGVLSTRTTVVPSNRPRDVEGWSDGVLMSLSQGYQEALRGPALEWILRIDTDALVIGPFAEAIGERFAAEPSLGIVGACRFGPDGRPRDQGDWGASVRRICLPISLWRLPVPKLRTGLFGVGRERCRLIQDAIGYGYEPGVHCQGGAYALNMAAARAMERRGLLDCHLWKGVRFAEDVVVALQACAVGFSLGDMAAPGQPFAVQHVGMPGTPIDLVDSGYGVVHSLKSDGIEVEFDLRAEFRQLRHARSEAR